MSDLTVIIPARNELFINKTIEDLLAHIEGDTEIIAVLDGTWPEVPIPDNPRLTLIHYEESVGQRAACNAAAKMATSRYLMKCDAHCAFDQGFDVKLMADMRPDWTVVPVMRNLHAFDWVCPNGHRRYQGPSGPCLECGEPTVRDVVWIPKTNPQSKSYCFDTSPHFQYFGAYTKRPGYKSEGMTETMSLQGSCWMLTRQRYHELNVCDEEYGSWGSQGIEVAVKTWLSGGACMVNHNTWYGHMFRTQGADFGFPYPMSGHQVARAKKTARKQFFEGTFPGQKLPLSWLVKKFWPVPGWSEADLHRIQNKDNAEIVYYTCNTHPEDILTACRRQLLEANLPITSVSLNKEIEFGDQRIVMHAEKGILTMHRQILAGLMQCSSDTVFLAEADVLYHPSHFEFRPKRKDVFYYNSNVWRVRAKDGHAVWTDDLHQLSGLVARRDLLVDYFQRKIAQIETTGFDHHYEPGTQATVYPRMPHGKYGCESYYSAHPNLDIRHEANVTPSKWSPDEFKNSKYARGWLEADFIPEWYEAGKFPELLGHQP